MSRFQADREFFSSPSGARMHSGCLADISFDTWSPPKGFYSKRASRVGWVPPNRPTTPGALPSPPRVFANPFPIPPLRRPTRARGPKPRYRFRQGPLGLGYYPVDPAAARSTRDLVVVGCSPLPVWSATSTPRTGGCECWFTTRTPGVCWAKKAADQGVGLQL